MVLAVITAVIAAWWPARAAARVPVIAALSGRPPRPSPATGWPPPAPSCSPPASPSSA